MNLILIAVHKCGNQLKDIEGFRLLDRDTGEVKDIPYDSVINTLRNKDVTVEGIDVSGIEPKGSNGSFDRYTQLANGITMGKCPIVVCKEYPDKIYDVANHLGKVVQMDMQSILQFSSVEGIANGKIVTNENGSYISSISGEYLKDKSFKDRAYGDKLKLKMDMLGVRDYIMNDKNYVVGTNEDIERIAIGKGCLGVEKEAFKGFCKLKQVMLPNTCIQFSEESFKDCRALEEIIIPEGVTVIPKRCFENCKSLKEVTFPNSLRKIESQAFKGSGVKNISLGPVRPDIASNAFPPNTKVKVRR